MGLGETNMNGEGPRISWEQMKCIVQGMLGGRSRCARVVGLDIPNN